MHSQPDPSATLSPIVIGRSVGRALARFAPGLSLAVALAAGLLCALLAGATMAAPSLPAVMPESPAAAPRNALTLTTDERGLTIDLSTNKYELAPVTLDGAVFVRLSAPDTTPMGDPGAPEIPVRSALLAVPVGAAVHLTVLAGERNDSAGRSPGASAGDRAAPDHGQ